MKFQRGPTLLSLYVAMWVFIPTALAGTVPNILLIIADDMRPEIGIYGNTIIRTPNLDRLMNKSTVFYNAHAQQALCGPSRTSFLVSRRPDSLKAFSNKRNPYWRKNVGNFTTLPQYFKEHGYRTISLGKVFHPGRIDHYDDYPYSWTDVPYHPSTQKYKDAKVCPGLGGDFYDNIICPVNVTEQPEKTLPDIQTTEEALRVLDDLLLPTGSHFQPFLLAVGLHKPHIPFKYPAQFKDLYPLSSIKLAADLHRPANLPPIAWNPFTDYRSRHDVASLNITFPYGELPKHFQAELIQSYYAASSYADSLVGKILDKVSSSRTLSDSTIIVFMSDHGVSLGEHAEWSKYSNYDIATRVPFSILVPNSLNLTTKSSVYDMVELVDLFPTLVDLTSLGHLEKCRGKEITCTEGKSLVHAMVGIGTNPDAHSHSNISITQYPRPSLVPQLDSDQPAYKDIRYMGYSLKTTTHRYVRWVGFDQSTMTSNMSDVHAEELYDITSDPDEDNNLILMLRPKARSLFSTLLEHLNP